MANSKISALTAATTPLDGTEVLPIVQSSTTKKVAVSDVTAGRDVQGASFESTTLGSGFFMKSGANKLFEFKYSGGCVINRLTGTTLYFSENGSNQFVIAPTSGDVTFSTGNLIQGTAAKGVNFTANTPAAGMTSQLLNWYEEGTWTPAQGSGLTVVGAFSSTGRYTRIGRQVIISGTVTGATSVAVAAAGIITTNLPFTVGTAGHGNATNAAVNASAAIICTATNVTSAGAIAATGTVTFSATYFV